MSIFLWCTRRSGGLLSIATIALSAWVVYKEFVARRNGYQYLHHDSLSTSNYSSTGAGVLLTVFAYYSLIIHLTVFAFPLRSSWAVWTITKSLKKTSQSKGLKDFKFAHRRRGSSLSLSSSETLTSSKENISTSSSEAGDLDAEYYIDGDIAPEDRVIHAIVIPNYKEEMDSLRETLEVLASHPQARYTYDVYLAMEHRESNADVKALGLVTEFIKKFRSIDFTLHPSDIPGETAGKGSNVAWAARKLSERYSMSQRKDVMITGIDADSHLLSNYFALITTMHTAYPDTANTTLYSAPIIFDRNAQNVSAIVRVADILWSAAGMSGLYAGSTIAPPTSVYSLPLELVDRVGGWDCDSEAIGEDMHMYLKCFFALNGNLTVRTVLSPVSQTNVHGDSRLGLIEPMIGDVKARYKQGLRHMWGALDSGYAIRQFVALWRERKYTTRAFRPLHSTINDSADVYVAQPQILAVNGTDIAPESGIFSNVTLDTLKDPHYERIFYLFHRLFEAHFLPVQTTILIVASTIYSWLPTLVVDHHGIALCFQICNVLRALGFLEIVMYLTLYEKFHRTCAETRQNEMKMAGLSKGMHFSTRSFKTNWLDYFMVPLVAPMFGALPCAHAQMCHFWTLDLLYTVSKKVTRQRTKSFKIAEAMV